MQVCSLGGAREREGVPVADPSLRLCNYLSPVLPAGFVVPSFFSYHHPPQLLVSRKPVVAHHADFQGGVSGVLVTEVELKRLVKDEGEVALSGR